MTKDTDYFKAKLLALKSDITTRISAIDKDMRHEGISADWEEQAVERENDEVLDSLGTASQHELDMINLALRRVESGDYFTCRQCGNKILPERLKLLPYVTLCVHCAEQQN